MIPRWVGKHYSRTDTPFFGCAFIGAITAVLATLGDSTRYDMSFKYQWSISIIFCNSWKIYLHYQIIFFKIIVDISHGKDIAGFDDMLCSLANAIRTRECTKKVRNISCAYMIFIGLIIFACVSRQSYPYIYSSSEKPDDDVRRKYTSDKIFTYQRPRSRRKRKSVRSKQPLYSKHGYSR